MAESPVDIVESARRLADLLETAAVPYAGGGAIAYGHWGIPRGTADVDLTLFLDEPEWPKALALLQREGVAVDTRSALDELGARGSCRLTCGEFPVDLFVPSIPFYGSVQRRVVTRPLLGRALR